MYWNYTPWQIKKGKKWETFRENEYVHVNKVSDPGKPGKPGKKVNFEKIRKTQGNPGPISQLEGQNFKNAFSLAWLPKK